jgi:transcriptional regulator with GAF, ATPase, and Fis domain
MDSVLDYSDDVRKLAALAADPAALDETLHTALRALADAVPYDLAVVYELHDDVLVARAAEGVLVNDAVKAHRLPLARFPTIRDALRRRRPTALTEHDHEGEEGDPYDGVLDLPPGHSCMVVPLYADRRDIGIITLDRRLCEPYADQRVGLAGVYGNLVSLAIVHAEQAELLDRYRRQLTEENRLLRAQHTPVGGPAEQLLRARAPLMHELAETAQRVAEANVPVLIEGETGVGKELLAAAVHEWSERRERPFVKLNCAAIPENLVESELFGHVKGAFSGATRDRNGRFVTANGGTLLLDEVGDMPLAAQAKLLRVLQEGTFEPVGSDRSVRVDVRVVAATNVDLRAAAADGRFREDLYFRLAVFPLRVPPLRERVEDIGPIVEAHLLRLRATTGRGPWVLSPAAERALGAHPWPGNVRELINAVERAVIVRPAGELSPADLGLAAGSAARSRKPLSKPPASGAALPTFREQERAFLERALEHAAGQVSGPDGAAAQLDLKPTTLWSKLKKHGIDRKRFTRGR